jgi:phage N-6-adenine-methyltransferase
MTANSNDERFTPPDLFAEQDRKYRFTLDAAASWENHKCFKFFTREDDGLAQSWSGETVWCNPPYSDVRPWVEKAFLEVRRGCRRVVILLPNNRQEQPFWQELIEPVRDRGMGIRTEFLPRRRNFGTPENPEGHSSSSPPFGLVVVIVEPPPKVSLWRALLRGL